MCIRDSSQLREAEDEVLRRTEEHKQVQLLAAAVTENLENIEKELALSLIHILFLILRGAGFHHRADNDFKQPAADGVDHDGDQTVSYTHLDVYKRQALWI